MAKKNTTVTETAAPTVTMSVEELQAMIAAAVTAALPQKKGKAKAEKPARPEGLPLEPSTFKVPGGGPFGLYVPDGWAGLDKAHEPPTDQAIPVNKRDRDGEKDEEGNFPVSETRYYMAGKRGWKRAKKDGGWVSYFPTRVEVDEEDFAQEG